MTFDRDALRRDLRARRRALSPQDRISGAEQLAARLLELPFAPATGYVGGYWAVDGEIGLHAWQLRLPPGCIYCLPVLGDDDVLRFAPWRPGDPLVSNRFGIPEPDLSPTSLLHASEMAMVVTPLVGFDHSGQRLGMGGGWYDRTFQFRRAASDGPFLVGAAFDIQATRLPAPREWDVALDAVCAPSDTHVFAHLNA